MWRAVIFFFDSELSQIVGNGNNCRAQSAPTNQTHRLDRKPIFTATALVPHRARKAKDHAHPKTDQAPYNTEYKKYPARQSINIAQGLGDIIG